MSVPMFLANVFDVKNVYVLDSTGWYIGNDSLIGILDKCCEIKNLKISIPDHNEMLAYDKLLANALQE